MSGLESEPNDKERSWPGAEMEKRTSVQAMLV